MNSKTILVDEISNIIFQVVERKDRHIDSKDISGYVVKILKPDRLYGMVGFIDDYTLDSKLDNCDKFRYRFMNNTEKVLYGYKD